MNRIPDLQLPGSNKSSTIIPQKEKNTPSFKDTLTNYLNEVNELQIEAKDKIEKTISGEITDVHQAMIAMEKASVGLELTLAIRNKLLDAYREIMRMHG